MNQQIIVQLIQFGLIGVWNTLFDFIIFWSVLWSGKKFLKDNALKQLPVIGHVSGFLCSNILSYFLNRYFTFSASQNDRGILVYALVSVFSLGISSLCMYLLTQRYQKQFTRFLKVLPFGDTLSNKIPTCAKLCATALSMITNFLGYRFIVFG